MFVACPGLPKFDFDRFSLVFLQFDNEHAAFIQSGAKSIVTWLIARFPALGIGCMFSRAWHRLHVFPHLSMVACFPALGTGCIFSRAWHRSHVFPRLAPVACFPALGTGYMFSHTWHRLQVFPRLAPITCFRALGTGYMFSRVWHRRPVACVIKEGTSDFTAVLFIYMRYSVWMKS